MKLNVNLPGRLAQHLEQSRGGNQELHSCSAWTPVSRIGPNRKIRCGNGTPGIRGHFKKDILEYGFGGLLGNNAGHRSIAAFRRALTLVLICGFLILAVIG